MADFNPYHKWLGIPPDQQPVSHYRLLGIENFEFDADVIEIAAERQTLLLRTFQTGPNSELAERLLNEVSEARVCLLTAEDKAEYDTQLKASQQSVQPVPGEIVPEEAPAPLVTPQRSVVSKRPSTRTQSLRRPAAKPLWQQPWVMATAGVVPVVVLIIFYNSSGNKERGQVTNSQRRPDAKQGTVENTTTARTPAWTQQPATKQPDVQRLSDVPRTLRDFIAKTTGKLEEYPDGGIGIKFTGNEITDDNLRTAIFGGTPAIPFLKHIELDHTNVGDATVKDLTQAKQIRRLYLGDTKVTDACISDLLALTNLETLSLWDTEISERGVNQLSEHPSLRVLHGAGVTISPSEIASLSRLPHLSSLDIFRQQLDSEHVKNMVDCPELETLGLFDVQISSQALRELSDLRNLSHLVLRKMQIGKIEIEHLKRFTNLIELDLRENSIADGGLAELQKALPNCKIEH